MSHRFQIRCPECSFAATAGLPEMLRWLQAAGMMRRAKEPDEAVVEELFVQSAGRFSCSECGRVGLIVEDTEDNLSDEAWGMPRTCTRCRQPIPPARLEVFPDAMLCAACQQSAESAVADSETPEYCPRCGSVMVLRSSAARGATRYLLVCPACSRR
jgi:predicted RNA-binding Zn-ribbon protein involved in translation (DUF1610 family)